MIREKAVKVSGLSQIQIEKNIGVRVIANAVKPEGSDEDIKAEVIAVVNSNARKQKGFSVIEMVDTDGTYLLENVQPTFYYVYEITDPVKFDVSKIDFSLLRRMTPQEVYEKLNHQDVRYVEYYQGGVTSKLKDVNETFHLETSQFEKRVTIDGGYTPITKRNETLAILNKFAAKYQK